MSEINALPPNKQPAVKIIAMPKDTNANGCIFGGWLLSQMDIAGAIPAIQRARGKVVTVAMNSVEFHEPVFVGDIISCYADIIKTGNSSITIQVEVYAERDPEAKKVIKVTAAEIVYVAVTAAGTPKPLPPG